MNRSCFRASRGSLDTLLVLGLGALIFTAVGGYFAYLGVVRIQDGWASRAWPVVSGQVLASGVAEIQSLPPSNRPQDVRFGASYLAQVSVRYPVGETVYTTDRLTVDGNQFPFEFQARWAADRYPRDATVSVSHHPEDPERAVLEPGLTLASFFPLAAGGVIIAGIWSLVIVFARQSRRDSPKPRRRKSRLP